MSEYMKILMKKPLSEYMKIEQPTVLLKRNHYIKCFCFIQNVAKILTGCIDGLSYCESINLLCESIYLHLQLYVFLHLINASFLRDRGRFIPKTRKILLLCIVEQLI